MELQTFTLEVADYLPSLKQKFIVAVGETNEMEQLLLDSAFSSYELYLAFRNNDNSIPSSAEPLRVSLLENEHIQLAALALYYNKITGFIQPATFIEFDRKLLVDVFETYQDGMLVFPYQKKHYQEIKQLLVSKPAIEV